jgi:hypothetical protein
LHIDEYELNLIVPPTDAPAAAAAATLPPPLIIILLILILIIIIQILSYLYGPFLWSSSQEFLAANPEVPGSIPGATTFSE